jgi:hypothetical protein
MPGTKKSTAQLYIDRLATIYSNGSNAINGADHAIFEDDIIASMANKTTDYAYLGLFYYDVTRIYYQHQGVIYNDGSGDALFVCSAATTTGVWNAAHWTKINSKAQRSGLVNITTDPQIITFSTVMPSTAYNIHVRVYDDSVGATDGASSVITNKIAAGFTISSPIIGASVYLEYDCFER